MDNSVIRDNFSAQRPRNSQKIGAPGQRGDEPRNAGRASAGTPADVARAQRRLAQELDQARGSRLASPAQAQAALARLKAEIATQPAAALNAHGRLDGGTLQAAMARPKA